MMKWYERAIVPRLLNFSMRSGEFEQIRSDVVHKATGTVLEIGVGPGYNISHYQKITKLYALEPLEELIQIAKTRTQHSLFPIEFLHARAEHIPLPDHSVDTVLSTWTLCSVSDPKQVLTEIARVIRPNGCFIFVDHGASPKPYINVLQRAITRISRHFTGNCHHNRKIKTLIEEAGFGITALTHPHERFKPLIYNYKGVATLY